MYVQPIQISPKLLSITICLPRYLTTSTACYVFLRKMSPKNLGAFMETKPPKRAYSAPYMSTPSRREATWLNRNTILSLGRLIKDHLIKTLNFPVPGPPHIAMYMKY